MLVPQIEFLRLFKESGKEVNADFVAGFALAIRVATQAVESLSDDGDVSVRSMLEQMQALKGLSHKDVSDMWDHHQKHYILTRSEADNFVDLCEDVKVLLRGLKGVNTERPQ